MGMIKILLDCGYGTFAMKRSLHSPSIYMGAFSVLSAGHLALHHQRGPRISTPECDRCLMCYVGGM